MKVAWVRGLPKTEGEFWFFGTWCGERKVRRMRTFKPGSGGLIYMGELTAAWDNFYLHDTDGGPVWHAPRVEPVPDAPEETDR